MIKYFLSFFLLTSFQLDLFSQYEFDLIPPELLKDANVVIRENIKTIEIHNISNSTETGTYAATILNAKGKSAATYAVYYSESFSKSVSMTGELYDANGKLIKKLKKKDLNDISAVSGGTLYSDSRLLVGELTHSQYPYTVVFKYRQPKKDQILVPKWYPQSGLNQSVQKASLVVNITKELELKYKNLRIDDEPIVQDYARQKVYQWDVENLKAIDQEVLAPNISNQLPIVLLTTTDFKWEGFEGNAEDWKNYGKFFYDLNEGRDELPEELAAKVKTMCTNIEDPREKIRILYEFMQKNTRYVSVQLGIGGWQTYDAAYVYQNGYGDCKALSNYMKGMLREIGISSYVASIYGGAEGLSFQTDFPSGQFNHVILCVPMAQDTMWLECTSSENPTGYLGDFTEDRYALLNTPEGGKLVRTPSSPPEANQQRRKATVVLDEKGNAEVEVAMTYTGYQQDPISRIALNKGTKDQEKWMRNSINAGSFQLKSFNFEQGTIPDTPKWLNHYALTATQWAGVSGNRMFLKPNVLEQRSFVPPILKNRQQPVSLNNPYLDTDSITYILPVNYRIESMPNMPLKIEEEYGRYEANIIQVDPRTLIYVRKLRMEKMDLPPESYEGLRNFIKSIVKADKLQIVLSDKS